MPFRLSATSILCAVMLLVFCAFHTRNTQFYPGNADQVAYMSAAESFSEGRGFREADGTPLVLWPPGYSIVLAMLGGGVTAARLINMFGLWATVLLGYVALRQYDTPRIIAIATCLAFIVFVSDFEWVFESINCEALFMPVLMLWFVSFQFVADEQGAWINAASGAVMGLTRYIGIPFALLGLLWVMYRRGIRGAIVPTLITIIPIGMWLIRNYILVGRLTGHQEPGNYGVNDLWHLFLAIDKWAALVILSSALCVFLVALWRRGASRISSFSTSADL